MTKMDVFLKSCTLGRGTVPFLPEELRRKIYDLVRESCSFSCSVCRSRVLCTTQFRSIGSYQSLLSVHRMCIHCYSETLT